MEGINSPSASVKFFGGKFNLLNNNKRLVVVLEEEGVNSNDDKEPLRVALVIVGGVGVNTITYDESMVGKSMTKGQELSAFRAGGRLVVLSFIYMLLLRLSSSSHKVCTHFTFR
jgi:hypothetical protein